MTLLTENAPVPRRPTLGTTRPLGVFEDRLFTVPNLVSMMRLAMVPVVVWLLLVDGNRWQAGWLWGVIGATDWVDGWWARRFDVVSEFGKIIDPFTDRVSLVVPLVAMGIDGAVAWWLIAITVFREGFVFFGGMLLKAFGSRTIAVTRGGKIATFGLYFAFPGLLLGASTHSTAAIWGTIGWFLVVPSLIYSYASAAQYIPLGRDALREGRAART